MTQEPHEYVRSVLYLTGFKNPTDEIVSEIYATAEQSSIVTGAHPYVIVDALIEVLRAYYPVTKSLEFIESMEQLQSQPGLTQEKLDSISQGILRLAEEIPQPAKPKQKISYYQRNKAEWWKGKAR